MAARGDGMRLQLSSIRGVTSGDAAKVLKTPYRFQCPPLDAFSYTKGHGHTRYTTYDGDEFLVPAGRTLTSTIFRTLAVEYAGFVVEFDWDVAGLVDDLERIVASGSPFDFLATHAYNDDPELHMLAVLESVTVTEQAGEQDARYLDLTITEWRRTSAARRRLTSGGGRGAFTIVLGRDGSYNMPQGIPDMGMPLTLAGIAKAAYGMPSAAQKIAAAQKPPLKNWGSTAQLIRHGRYSGHGGSILVPSLATITK